MKIVRMCSECHCSNREFTNWHSMLFLSLSCDFKIKSAANILNETLHYVVTVQKKQRKLSNKSHKFIYLDLNVIINLKSFPSINRRRSVMCGLFLAKLQKKSKMRKLCKRRKFCFLIRQPHHTRYVSQVRDGQIDVKNVFTRANESKTERERERERGKNEEYDLCVDRLISYFQNDATALLILTHSLTHKNEKRKKKII